MNTLAQEIEALLFSVGSLKKNKIVSILNSNKKDVQEAIEELKKIKNNSGVVLLDDDESVSLGTNSKFSNILQKFYKYEEDSVLSEAAKETLAIILYSAPIRKVDLDYIRGVNTHSTVRKLILKGLVREEQVNGKKVLNITIDLLKYMGVNEQSQLKDFDKINNSIKVGLENIMQRVADQYGGNG